MYACDYYDHSEYEHSMRVFVYNEIGLIVTIGV